MRRRSSVRRADARKLRRLQFESLETRALLSTDGPSWSVEAFLTSTNPLRTDDRFDAEQAFVAEAPVFSVEDFSGSQEAGVRLESDALAAGEPAPSSLSADDPPIGSAAEIVVQRPFVTGVLTITQYSKSLQRLQIDAPRKGGSGGLSPYVRTTNIFGYEDYGDYVVVYPEAAARDRPRPTVEYHFNGVERTVRYNGTAQKLVQEIMHLAESKTGWLTTKALSSESYETTEEVRLYQRSEETYDELGRKVSTRTEHWASNGDNLVLEVLANEGGTAQVSAGEERYDLEFRGRIQTVGMSYGKHQLTLLEARGETDLPAEGLAKISLTPQSIQIMLAPQATLLATQAFATGSIEVFDYRNLAFSRPETRTRLIVPDPRSGKPVDLLSLRQVTGFDFDEQGSLVVHNLESSRKTSYTFHSTGRIDRVQLNGSLEKTEIRDLWLGPYKPALLLTGERWARHQDDGLRVDQDRVLSRDHNGEVSRETYVRYLGGDERLIWSQAFPDTGQAVSLSYVSQDRAETVQLVALTSTAFDDQYHWLASLEGIYGYEPGLVQRMIECRIEDDSLQISFRLVPRPMYLQRTFGDGKLLIEERRNLDRFVYILDASGNLLFERQIDRFLVNSDSVQIVAGVETSFLRADGTVDAVSYVPHGSSQIAVRDTSVFVTAAGRSRLSTLSRGWYLDARELQKETYEYAADGSLLAVRLKRNPLEWLEEQESPIATFALDPHDNGQGATMFLSYTRTGELRDLGVRQVVFDSPPELTRDGAGLVQAVRGYESTPLGEPRFVQLEYADRGTRFNERLLFENRFGTAGDERLGRVSVLEHLDRQGNARLIFRLSGSPLAADRAAWHPFDLFFAAQPLVEYEIVSWSWAGVRLLVTLIDGSRLSAWADETSVVFDTERTWESAWGRLTSRNSVRPTHNFGAGEGLILAPFRGEIVDGRGRIWQSEHATYQSPLTGDPVFASRWLVWGLADGRLVEYRQRGQVHVLTVTSPADRGAVKSYRFLAPPQLDRLPDFGLVTRVSGRVATPAGPQGVSLELFEWPASGL